MTLNLNPDSAMVVLSGGQDSTTCLGWALAKFPKVAAVSFDYGQRHNIEVEAARNVISFFRAKLNREINHEIVYLSPDIFKGTSPLTDKNAELEMYRNYREMEVVIGDRIEKTFVPMRNFVFLGIAANRAVVKGSAMLVTGVCQADNANYPDCREIFVRDTEEAINGALGVTNFRIETPLMNLSKAESIKLARSLPHTYEALAWTHTAYDGRYPPTSKDHASVLRAHGFEEAGLPDPLVLRAFKEGLMDLPETANYSAFRARSALARCSAQREE
jgi:7-cyano-7-deazaguanine synthase